MKKLLQIFNLLIIACLLMSSCSRSLYTSNGARDNRPLLFENEYDIKELGEIKSTGKAFWGIPISQKEYKRKDGKIDFFFNGVSLTRTPKILPILTLLANTFAIGLLFHNNGEEQWTETNYIESEFEYVEVETVHSKKRGFGYIPSFLLALPIAGTINNFIWSGAKAEASSTIERQLIEENPGVDLFFFPKYQAKKYNVFHDGPKYLWWQKADVNAKVKGATIKLTK